MVSDWFVLEVQALHAYTKYFNLHSLKIFALLQRNVAVFFEGWKQIIT